MDKFEKECEEWKKIACETSRNLYEACMNLCNEESKNKELENVIIKLSNMINDKSKRIIKLSRALDKACEELSLCYVDEDKTEEEWKAWLLNE